MSTKVWYSTIGNLATRWLSPFSGVTRACAHAHIFFTAASKREAVRCVSQIELGWARVFSRCLMLLEISFTVGLATFAEILVTCYALSKSSVAD